MKKKYILIGVILSVLLPINVNALSGSISISCGSTSIEVGSSTSCTVTGYSDSEVSALAMNLSSGGTISISNIVTSSIWQGNGSDGNIQLYTDSNKSGNFSIATFTASGNNAGNGSITASGISFTGADFSETGISGKNIIFTVKEKEVPKPDPTPEPKPSNNNNQTITSNNTTVKKSSDATLKGLSVNPGSINFNFDKYEYDVEVGNDVDKIEISAEGSSDKAKVTIPSDLSLKVGKNSFSIEVEAEDGTKKEYIINVNRLDRKLSSNSNLSKLVINGYKIDFTKDKYIYNIGDIKDSSLDITFEVEDKKSTAKIYGNDNIGKDDVIVIKVTAEDKTTSEYLLYVNNTSNCSIKDILLVAFLILLIASLVINFMIVFKKRKKLDFSKL